MCVLQLAEQLSPLDVFLGLMAAAAHDVDHPGVNQPFLVKTRHHLASLYQVEDAISEVDFMSCADVVAPWPFGTVWLLWCLEHVCAGEPPLEVHCGHAARVGTAVAPAC